MRDWINKTRSRIGDREGDARALWELAQGYAVSWRDASRGRHWRGRHYIDMALSVAETDTVRVRCLQEFAGLALVKNDPARAIQLINSLIHQFDGEPAERLEATLERLKVSRSAALNQPAKMSPG